jgi:hypothetical protein
MFEISKYLPSNVLTNSDLQLEFPDYNFERLGKKIGIEERRICEANETPLDLAVKACENLFEKVDKKVIDFVIYCTQSPEYYLPTTACILQDKLGLRKHCGAFDYNLGCSGYIYGLAMAKSFINSKLASNVLLVTAWLFRRKVQQAMKSNEEFQLEKEVHVDEFEMGTPQKGEQGRSKSEKKVRVVIAFEYLRGKTGRVYAKIIEDYSSKSLEKIFHTHFSKDAKITTDGWSGYKALMKEYPYFEQKLSNKG